MSGLRRFWFRLRAFLNPGRSEQELAREIDSHLTLLADDFRRKGMAEDEARRAAARALGSVIRAKELHREARSLRWLEDARQDIRHAIRGLAHTRGFTAVAVLTIALGVGATTAVFSIVDAVLVRPLPYESAGRLLRLIEHLPDRGNLPGGEGPWTLITEQGFVDWRARAQAFSHMAAFGLGTPALLETPNGPVQVSRTFVSPALFSMLGVRPIRGRLFDESDGEPGSAVALITASAWKRHFGSRASVLNGAIRMRGRDYTVIGILPDGIAFPMPNLEVWTPYQIGPPEPNRTTLTMAVGRLRDGLTIEQARAEAESIGGKGRFELVGVKELLVGPVRPAIRMLILSVAVVLLLVCVNVANLMLARTAARQREIALRLAIGAGRGRIARQILTESLVLSLAGGVTGAALAFAAVSLVKALSSVHTPELFQLMARMQFGGNNVLPRLDEIAVDGRVLAVALITSILAGAVFGLAPALAMARVDFAQAVGMGRTRSGRRRATSRLAPARNILTLAQLGLATMLLVCAGLLVHSFVKLTNVETGYDPDDVLTFQLLMPPDYPAPRKAALTETIVSRLQSLPGVASAGFTNIPPLLGAEEFAGLVVPPGRSRDEILADPLRPQTRSVSEGYLKAIGARLVEGRWLRGSDDEHHARAVMVNRALARRYFSTGSPVGAFLDVLRRDGASAPWQIVGVVDDIRQARLDEDPYPVVYMDARQMQSAFTNAGNPLGFLSVAIRVDGDPGQVLGASRALIRSVDPAAGLDSVAMMRDLVSGSVVRPRFYATILAIFAGLAGVIAIVGVYGVLSYLVVQRNLEIGIRMAIGAQAGAVLRLVLRQAAVWTAVGVGAGLLGAVAMSRYLATLLYGLTPQDPPTYLAVAVIFAAIAMVASYIPARRATRVDPLMVLRSE